LEWLFPDIFQRRIIRSPEGTFVYKGDVQADGVKNKNNVVDATIKGEVFREEQGSGGRCKSQNPKLDTL
jgi:hypothetical protein